MANTYVQNNWNGTFSVVTQKDDGTYDQRIFSNQREAEDYYNLLMGKGPKPTPGTGNSWDVPPAYLGYQQQKDQLAALQAADQLALARRRLDELEIPMTEAEKQVALAKITGYYIPSKGLTMTEDQALDFIANKKPDVLSFFQANGWQVGSPEQKRAAIKNWLTFEVNKGKTPLGLAKELGAEVGGGITAAAWGDKDAVPTQANLTDTRGFLRSMQGARNADLAARLVPNLAFGTVKAGPSWEQALLDFEAKGGNISQQDWKNYWNPTSTENTAFGAVSQPHTIRPDQWAQLGSTGQERRRGLWLAQGLDPTRMEQMMRASWATGEAAKDMYWK